MLEEAGRIHFEDPELDVIVGIHADLAKTSALLEGALWTRRIIKGHAKSLGLPMLRLTREQANASMQSDLEATRSKESVDNFIGKRMAELREKDPELAKGIDEMAKYNIDQTDFFHGATIIFFSLRRVQDSVDLGEKLNGSTA